MSPGSGIRCAPGNVLPVALLTHLYPSCTGLTPVDGHTRPPSFWIVTVIGRVSPATHEIGTLSFTQSTLQSAELNHMSRTGWFFVAFHQAPAVCRSKRAMYEPMAGTANGTATVTVPPGATGVVIVPAPPCPCATDPFFKSLYETFVPAGIDDLPRFVIVTGTLMTAPGKPAFGRSGSMSARSK